MLVEEQETEINLDINLEEVFHLEVVHRQGVMHLEEMGLLTQEAVVVVELLVLALVGQESLSSDTQFKENNKCQH